MEACSSQSSLSGGLSNVLEFCCAASPLASEASPSAKP